MQAVSQRSSYQVGFEAASQAELRQYGHPQLAPVAGNSRHHLVQHVRGPHLSLATKVERTLRRGATFRGVQKCAEETGGGAPPNGGAGERSCSG